MTEDTAGEIATLATKAVYTTSAVTVIAGYTIGEWAGMIGIGATLATFAANIYFRVKADQREQTEHDIRMAKIEAETKRT